MALEIPEDWKPFHTLIASHVAGAEKFLQVHHAAIEEYQSYPSEGENNTPTVVGADNVPESSGTKMHPKLRMNLLFPHVQSIVASIVPTTPKARPIPRVPYESVPGDPIHVATQAREAVILDKFTETFLVDSLREAVRISSVLKYAVIFTWWNAKTNTPEFEVHSPLTGWFDPTVRRANRSPYFVVARAVKHEDLKKQVKDALDTDSEDLWMPPNVYNEVCEINDRQVPDFHRALDASARAAAEVFKWAEVYDIFDYERGTYQKWVKGINDYPIMYGALPHKFVRQFYVITLNDNLVDGTGLSDWALVRGAMKQQSEAMTLLLHGARSALRILFADLEALDNEDDVRAAYAKARSNDLVGVSLKDGKSLDQAFQWSQSPGTAPEVTRLIEMAERVIRTTLTSPEHGNGQVGGSNNATEVALADAAVKTSQAPRASTVNRAVEWAAGVIMGYLAEKLPPGVPVKARQTVQSNIKGMSIDRSTLRLPEFAYDVDEEDYSVQAKPPEKWEDDFVYEVEAAFNDAASQLTRLRMLEQWFKILAESPFVDKKVVMSEILSLLHMVAALTEPEQAPPGAPGLGEPPTLPPGPGQGLGPLEDSVGLMQRAPGEDGVATGALPLGASEPAVMPFPLGGPGDSAPLKGG